MAETVVDFSQNEGLKIYDFYNDYVFKWIFGQQVNARFTICLLNALLDLRGEHSIEAVTIMNPFNDRQLHDDKLSIVDGKFRTAPAAFISLNCRCFRMIILSGVRFITSLTSMDTS